eukprot:10607828-Ditylum_brightwellii.AAC.1
MNKALEFFEEHHIEHVKEKNKHEKKNSLLYQEIVHLKEEKAMKESCTKKIKGEMDAMMIYIRTMEQKLAVIKQRKDIALFQTQREKKECINRKMNDIHMQHQIEYISCDNFGSSIN